MSLANGADSIELKALLEQIRSLIPGEQDVITVAHNEYAIDGIDPKVIVFPSTLEQVAAILNFAGDSNFVIDPGGGMTRQTIGNRPTQIDLLLMTARLNDIDYDTANATVTAGAGVTIADLQAKLAVGAHFLPLDPLLSGSATVGGVLAAGMHSSGPLSSGFQAPGDFCDALEFVTTDGKVVTAVHHLRRLMIGSFGTLGVITRATFRLFPKPTCVSTFTCEFPTLEETLECRAHLLAAGVTPMSLEIASPRAQEYLQELKPARDPDLYSPLAPVKSVPWKLFLRIGGEEDELERCRQALKGFVPVEVRDAGQQSLFQCIADWEAAVAARHRNATIFHVSVAVGELANALVVAEKTAVEHNLLFAGMARPAMGTMIAAFLPLGVDPFSAMQCAVATSAFRGRLPEDASAVVVRCPPDAKDYFNVWGSTTTDMQLMRAVRKTFDPKEILNRGRFIV
jgi:glycolate oxidase FAD binding subunit